MIWKLMFKLESQADYYSYIIFAYLFTSTSLRFKSSAKMSTVPFMAATCSGVWPCLSGRLASTLGWESILRTTSTFQATHATSSGEI